MQSKAVLGFLFSSILLFLYPLVSVDAQNGELRIDNILQLELSTPILEISWNFDDTLIALATGNDTVRIVDVETGNLVTLLEDEIGVVTDIAWNPTNNQLLISNNLTRIWNQDSNSWNQDFRFPNALEFANQNFLPGGNVDWHPNGELLAFVLRECNEESLENSLGVRVEIWNVINTTSFQIGGCNEQGYSIAKWNTNGDIIAISTYDNITFWDINTLEVVLSISDVQDVIDFAWSPDGAFLATGISKGVSSTVGDEDGYNFSRVVQIRSTDNGKIISESDGHINSITSLAWHPSGNLLATSGLDNTVRLWSVPELEELLVLDTHGNFVNAVEWSHDGSMLASAGRDGQLFIWNITMLQ